MWVGDTHRGESWINVSVSVWVWYMWTCVCGIYSHTHIGKPEEDVRCLVYQSALRQGPSLNLSWAGS